VVDAKTHRCAESFFGGGGGESWSNAVGSTDGPIKSHVKHWACVLFWLKLFKLERRVVRMVQTTVLFVAPSRWCCQCDSSLYLRISLRIAFVEEEEGTAGLFLFPSYLRRSSSGSAMNDRISIVVGILFRRIMIPHGTKRPSPSIWTVTLCIKRDDRSDG
jgi:hypothetical protein